MSSKQKHKRNNNREQVGYLYDLQALIKLKREYPLFKRATGGKLSSRQNQVSTRAMRRKEQLENN